MSSFMSASAHLLLHKAVSSGSSLDFKIYTVLKFRKLKSRNQASTCCCDICVCLSKKDQKLPRMRNISVLSVERIDKTCKMLCLGSL